MLAPDVSYTEDDKDVSSSKMVRRPSTDLEQ